MNNLTLKSKIRSKRVEETKIKISRKVFAPRKTVHKTKMKKTMIQREYFLWQ
jgi:hypothetical protein